MDRREVREQIFKLLFRVEFNEADEMPEQKELQEQLMSMKKKTEKQMFLLLQKQIL